MMLWKLVTVVLLLAVEIFCVCRWIGTYENVREGESLKEVFHKAMKWRLAAIATVVLMGFIIYS